MDPEEVFSAIFGGERFVTIIGEISLGRDMKEALQKAEEEEDKEDPTQRITDAKGREILSPEQKAKKEEQKAKKEAIEKRISAEVSRQCTSTRQPRISLLPHH